MSRFRQRDWFGIFIFCFCILMGCVMLGSLIWYANLPTIVSEGVIIDKYVLPSNTSYITTYVNKITIINPIHSPERPTFVIRKTDGSITKLTVDEEAYYARKIGDTVSFHEKDYR